MGGGVTLINFDDEVDIQRQQPTRLTTEADKGSTRTVRQPKIEFTFVEQPVLDSVTLVTPEPEVAEEPESESEGVLSVVDVTDRATLFCGDSRSVLQTLPANSIDAIVTDPPYGLSSEPDAAEVLSNWLAGNDYVHTGGGFGG